MQRRHFIRLSAATSLLGALTPLETLSAPRFTGAVLENKHFRYSIGADGKNLRFIHKPSGIDYLGKEKPGYFAILHKAEHHFFPTKIEQEGNSLRVYFEGTDLIITAIPSGDHIMLEITAINGPADTVSLLNMPLTVEAIPGEPFGACLLSQNLETCVKQLPALQTWLEATVWQRFGIQGARLALVGLPVSQMLETIRSVMKNASAVPYSDAGGAYAVQGKEGKGSYLMNFGTLTESTVDEWIDTCRLLGFNQIDNHGGEDFFSFGDFRLNPAKWPNGWDTYKAINERLHAAGISTLFHTYAFFIEKTSAYVTPIPHKDLGYFAAFTLAQPLSASATEITVQESTEHFSLITGFFVRNSLSLRIGEELIEFTSVTKNAPYRFTGCKRGVHNTTAKSHAAGEQAFHLKELYGMFVAGHDSALIGEIARHTAEIANQCNFDGLYFDAIDGSDILAGEEHSWYYSTKFIFEVARHLKKPIGMEFSSMKHHWWHYRSRWQAWDTPRRGYKRFIDIHSAAIKSDQTEHGLWQGHLPEIKKLASLKNGRLLLPLHFGWWINRTWEPPQIEPTFTDDIEYLCCRMIGNDAGLSMQEVEQKSLEEKPVFRRLFAIIKQYEELRHKNYFSEQMKDLLRVPGNEFKLAKDRKGDWSFKPVEYHKQKVAGLSHASATWSIYNKYNAQPLKFRLEVLLSIAAYDDPAAITLTNQDEEDNFTFAGEKGVFGKITRLPGKVNNLTTLQFDAQSQGFVPRDSAWINMEKSFEPSLNLQNNQGLGVWIKGDGNGQLLNLRLESPKHLSSGARGDHFIKIDFTGWQYVELVEIESTEFSNYKWPGSDFYVYDSFRHTIKFEAINKLQWWYNNLPAGKKVSCQLGPVKALPLQEATINNPVITVNGKKIILPFRIKSGQYLELLEGKECILYDNAGKQLQSTILPEELPLLRNGHNNISMGGDTDSKTSLRTQVTLITEGAVLSAAKARRLS